MSTSYNRRRDDTLTRRILAVLRRFFAFIGFSVVVSIVLVSINLSQMADRGGRGPQLRDNMVLSFVFDGDIVETPGKPSISKLIPRGVTLHDITRALDRAGRDARVKGLIARTEGMALSPAQIQELRDAIKAFRTKGKFAWIFSPGFGEVSSGMGDYYLASAFDQIWLQPVGMVAVNGMMMQVPFMRELFDKLGVQAQFVHKGIYKSAPESLTETGMSQPTRENMVSLLGDLSGQMVLDIAADRKVTPQDLRLLLNNAPHTGPEALKFKLVDRIGYSDEMLDAAEVLARGDNPPAKTDEEDTSAAAPGKNVIDLLDYADAADGDGKDSGLAGLMRMVEGEKEDGAKDARPKIALVYGVGEIVDFEGSGSGMSEGSMEAVKISSAIRAAARNKGVSAIVLRIDSPGGAPSASETIRRAILQAKDMGKPVVVSMAGMAASGGYWVASGADKIVAQPATLTGSIGVFGGKFIVSGLMEKVGLRVETLASGEHAAMWAVTRPFSPSELARFDAMMGHVYDEFIARVMEGRKMTAEQAEAVAQGRVFTGRQALEAGLVDSLGGLQTAVEEAKKLARIDAAVEPRLVRYPAPKSSFEMFLSLLSEGAVFAPRIDISAQSLGRALEDGARAHSGIMLKSDMPDLR